jgi:hypothetical protein
MAAEPGIAPTELEPIRRSRHRPRWNQFDYLHMRRLVDDLVRVVDCWPASQAALPAGGEPRTG